MADDIDALMKHLGIAKADVMGYSLGGGVCLHHLKRDGWYPEIAAGMARVSAASAEPMKQTAMYQMYARIAPKPADWPMLLTKIGDLLRKDYDWSKDVTAIAAAPAKTL
jgi:pimeloyl-ACP methyl ester carboxylesterase